jgi:cell division protein FtsW (lipid II flippase)
MCRVSDRFVARPRARGWAVVTPRSATFHPPPARPASRTVGQPGCGPVRPHGAAQPTAADLDRALTAVVALLCVIGLVMVGSASSVISISLYGSPVGHPHPRGMWMAVGVIAFGCRHAFDYRKLRRLSPLLLTSPSAPALVVLVPGLGVHAEGSSRWIGFGQFGCSLRS